MVKNIRPCQAAAALGIGLSAFRSRARKDPDVPARICLGPKATVARESDPEAFVKEKAQASFAAAVPVSRDS